MPDFTMPSLGADMDSGVLVEWLVKTGDAIHRGDPIAVVDTDKAAIEVESFHDGVVGQLVVEPGTRVQVGGVMARIEGAQAPAAQVPPVPAPGGQPTDAPRSPSGAGGTPPKASPPVRHHAAEVGVDLSDVVGTGPGGRILRGDVDAAAEAASPLPVAPLVPPVPAAAVGAPVPTGQVTRRRRVSPYARRLADELGVDLDSIGSGEAPVHVEAVLAAAAAAQVVAAPVVGAAPVVAEPARRSSRAAVANLMSRSKREVPHYYVATTVDLDALTSWLRRTNRDRPVADRIVPAAGILRATALAARELPQLNGYWVDGALVPGDDVHLGVAVAVRDGALVAPAIRHAADLALPELMHALRDLVTRARSGRLTRAEMADPTLTVTDLGDRGVEEVIGVIYPPQVALLGVGRIVERPWAVDGMLAVRPVVRLTLSGDHRATDGTTGARFLVTVDRLLQHPEEL